MKTTIHILSIGLQLIVVFPSDASRVLMHDMAIHTQPILQMLHGASQAVHGPSEPSPEASRLFLIGILDRSPTSQKPWNILKAQMLEPIRHLREGDRVEILTAGPGGAKKAFGAVIGKSAATTTDAVVRIISGISKEWVLRANLAKAMTHAYATFSKEGRPYKCCLLVLTTGKLSDKQVTDVQGLMGAFKARGWPVCLTCDEKRANRRLLEGDKIEGALNLRFIAEPSLGQWVDSMRPAKGRSSIDPKAYKTDEIESALATQKKLPIQADPAPSKPLPSNHSKQTQPASTLPPNVAQHLTVRLFEERLIRAQEEKMAGLEEDVEEIASQRHADREQITELQHRNAEAQQKIKALESTKDQLAEGLAEQKKVFATQLEATKSEVANFKKSLSMLTSQKAAFETKLQAIEREREKEALARQEEIEAMNQPVGDESSTGPMPKIKPSEGKSESQDLHDGPSLVSWNALLLGIPGIGVIAIGVFIFIRRRGSFEVCVMSSLSDSDATVSNRLILTPKSDAIPLGRSTALHSEPADALDDGVPFLWATASGRVFLEPRGEVLVNDEPVTEKTRIDVGDTIGLGEDGRYSRHVLTSIVRVTNEITLALEDDAERAIPVAS